VDRSDVQVWQRRVRVRSDDPAIVPPLDPTRRSEDSDQEQFYDAVSEAAPDTMQQAFGEIRNATAGTTTTGIHFK
jgi:hypothetical protein